MSISSNSLMFYWLSIEWASVCNTRANDWVFIVRLYVVFSLGIVYVGFYLIYNVWF
jgi:hypothetical protein